jgi:hypothetical protein
MERYYLSKTEHRDGYYEVHLADCRYFPEDRKDLGLHPNCRSAIFEAKKYFAHTNGCFFCLSECHVGEQPFLVSSKSSERHSAEN